MFISYRRSDSAAYAGRLYDRLVKHFGTSAVYRDQDSTEPGADFADTITNLVSRCDVLVAVIGRQWLAAGAEGHRRIDDPQDWVRLEISEALRRGILVVPVLVDDGDLPAAADLPDDLAGLARRQAIVLTDTTWNAGMGELLARLGPILDPPPKVLGSAGLIILAGSAASTAAGVAATGLQLLIGLQTVLSAVLYAALAGGGSSLALAFILFGAGRSAWTLGTTLTVAGCVGALANAPLGMIPLSVENGVPLYALGYGLSGLAAVLPSLSWRDITLATALGAAAGALSVAFQPPVMDQVGYVLVAGLTSAFIGGLTSIAIATAPRRLHRQP